MDKCACSAHKRVAELQARGGATTHLQLRHVSAGKGQWQWKGRGVRGLSGDRLKVMSNPDLVLETRSLVAGYGANAVCGPLDIEIHPGEAVGIVGFNASGKSTMVRTMIGAQPPLDGEIRVNSLIPDSRSALYRRFVSVVSDGDAFFRSLSVEEHLSLVANGHGVVSAECAVEEELEYFNLQSARDALPDSLSSGQRRRVILAAAVIRPASLLVLDEPEQRLDPVMRERLGARLRAMADAGTSILLVTHDAGVLQQAADRCLLIGEPIVEMTPAEGATAIKTA